MASVPKTEEEWLQAWMSLSETQRYLIGQMVKEGELSEFAAKKFLEITGVQLPSDLQQDSLLVLQRMMSREFGRSI